MYKEKNVLIVDDEPEVRQVLIRGIQRKFNKSKELVSITQAGNGQEAIELANSFPPDLILMDIRMPIMDGMEACSILRRDAKFAATKIIMLTCEIAEERSGLLSGADDYVIKPFDIKTLLIRIERGLFTQLSGTAHQYIEFGDVLTKDCFLATSINNEIARANRYQHPLSLLLLKFRPKNDVENDESLNGYLSNSLVSRDSDKVIKWSNSTFAILMPETNSQDAIMLAKRVVLQICTNDEFYKPFVGIANLEETVGDDLVGNAESSLNESIRTGNIVLNRLTVH